MLFISAAGFSGILYILTLSLMFLVILEIILPSMGLFTVLSIFIAYVLYYYDNLFYLHYGIIVGLGTIFIILAFIYEKAIIFLLLGVGTLLLGFTFTFNFIFSLSSILSFIILLIILCGIILLFYLALRKFFSLKKDQKEYFHYIGQTVKVIQINNNEQLTENYSYTVLFQGVYWNATSNELLVAGEQAYISDMLTPYQFEIHKIT